jgi:hypothetical protein
MIDVDAPDLRRIAAALRADMPEALPIMRAHLREAADGAAAGARSGAAGIRMETVTGTSRTVADRLLGRRGTDAVATAARTGGATAARARVGARYTRSLAEAVATGKTVVRTARRWDALTAKHRLRAQIAAGIRVRTTISKATAEVSVRTNQAPAFVTSRSSRRSANNYGKWRHPVFASPRQARGQCTWVEQRIANPMWWDDAIAPHAARAEADVGAALDEWAALVHHLIDRAA